MSIWMLISICNFTTTSGKVLCAQFHSQGDVFPPCLAGAEAMEKDVHKAYERLK